MDIINEYFVKPMVERTGYNVVNTLVYAAIALAAAYAIYKLLKRLRIAISERFALAVIPFVLLGAVVRVVVDAGRYPYTPFTTSPGIYVVIAAITLTCVLLLRGNARGMAAIGTLLLASQALLLPVPQNAYAAAQILALAILGTLVGLAIARLARVRLGALGSAVLLSHSLDGAATFVGVSALGYAEQHVLSNAIMGVSGSMLSFYAVKVLFASVAAPLVIRSDLKAEEKNYVLLLLVIFGLAPGARDALRILGGV